MPSCLAFFIMVLTCYNPCSYPMTSFLISCAIEECIRNFPLLSLPLECKLAPFVSRVHAFDALFVSARLFSLFILICARFNQLQSVVCLSFLLCLFFDSTNSERCFAILRANTNYNFLIYGNDFTQIQDIRSHCRTSALLITTGNQIISKLFDYRCCLLRLNWLFVN